MGRVRVYLHGEVPRRRVERQLLARSHELLALLAPVAVLLVKVRVRVRVRVTMRVRVRLRLRRRVY
tara:strand:- start:287 stop:484 length:198 start_codon:yes stop_codon:yes gene_type:complete